MAFPVGWAAQRLMQYTQGLGSEAGAGSPLSGGTALGQGGFAGPGVTQGPGGVSFGDTLKRAVEEVSGVQERAQDHVNAFLRGEPVELHQVMAATEEAGIALEMLIEVRNKFTEAYRTVINMQS